MGKCVRMLACVSPTLSAMALKHLACMGCIVPQWLATDHVLSTARHGYRSSPSRTRPAQTMALITYTHLLGSCSKELGGIVAQLPKGPGQQGEMVGCKCAQAGDSGGCHSLTQRVIVVIERRQRPHERA